MQGKYFYDYDSLKIGIFMEKNIFIQFYQQRYQLFKCFMNFCWQIERLALKLHQIEDDAPPPNDGIQHNPRTSLRLRKKNFQVKIFVRNVIRNA